MRTWRENPNARATTRNTEKGQPEKADKENGDALDEQRAEGGTTWGHRPHDTPPLPSATCQASDPLSKQKTEGDQGCKILAAASKGLGGGQLKVQLMIQKIPDKTGKVLWVGDIVLRKDETAAGQTYQYARIISVHVGSDGRVRSADVEYKVPRES
jgi:hypothetical protein